MLVTQDGKRFGKATAMDQAKLNLAVVPVGAGRAVERRSRA